MDMNSFLSWGMMATFAGASAVTALFTQMLKNVLTKLPTQWLSYIIAVVLLVVTTAATGGWAQPWTVWALVPLNAAMVSLASNGAYQAMDGMKKRRNGNDHSEQ